MARSAHVEGTTESFLKNVMSRSYQKRRGFHQNTKNNNSFARNVPITLKIHIVYTTNSSKYL